MTVSWTTKVEELGLAIVPLQYRTQSEGIVFAEAGKKRNGYVTIKMTLPERWGGQTSRTEPFMHFLANTGNPACQAMKAMTT